MFSTSTAALPSVLIIESENGDVFIVESKESKPQVEKILKTEKRSRSSRKKPAIKIESREASPVTLK